MSTPEILWRPSRERIARATITRYQQWLSENRDLRFEDYNALWRWSVADLEGFWTRHYPAVRRELMRRYPRHPWPEDGRTASPPVPRR